MRHSKEYLSKAIELLKKIEVEEQEKIEKAAEIISEGISQGKLLYVFGTGGHSHMATEEMYYRAGGLMPVVPIIDFGLVNLRGAVRHFPYERTVGYGASVLDQFKLKKDSIIIISNANGVNTLSIEAALECKKRGFKVMAITSPEFSKRVPPGHPIRHPNNKNLFEVVDLFIDCHEPFGDAVVEIEKCSEKVAPVSTILIAFTVNLVVIRVVEKLVEKGYSPPILRSGSIPGGDEVNKKLFEHYFGS